MNDAKGTSFEPPCNRYLGISAESIREKNFIFNLGKPKSWFFDKEKQKVN